jgi:uncharacterized protein YabN with tetrapyrrole methylase and pyrophosphatase domain
VVHARPDLAPVLAYVAHGLRRADDDVEDADQVQQSWDRLKADEKGGRGPLDGIPAGMPGLALLDALLRRVARLRLMPDSSERIITDLRSTLDSLGAFDAQVGGTDDRAGEIGELIGRLLVQATGLARVLGVEADATAREAGARLRAAVDSVVTRASGDGVEPGTLPEAERYAAWPSAT